MSKSPELLDAAAAVFMRYGFRKTSMDEVARAAQISRQGLYLHYQRKEALFRAAFEHVLERGYDAAKRALEDDARTLEERIVDAFDAWTGRYVGMFGDGASDLMEASRELKDLYVEYDARFVEAVTKTLRASDAMARHKGVGLSAKQLCEVLVAASRGLKHSSGSREAFGSGIRLAVRALCGEEAKR